MELSVELARIQHIREFTYMLDRGACSRRLGQQVERCIIVIADRRERPIHISPRMGIERDGNPRNEQPRDYAGQNNVLVESLPHEARPKNPDALAGQAGPAFRGMFQAENTALERVDVFETYH